MGRLTVGAGGVAHDGRPIRLPTRKALGLLLYLANEPGPQPRHRLATLLWPGDPTRSLASLRTELNRLRKAIGDHHLVSSRESVALVDADLDGDLPDELPGLGAEFEPWLEAARRRQVVAPRQLLPLLGRDHEMRRIQDAIRLARTGAAVTVHVAGAPGIGKTRLLHSVAEVSDRSSRVALAACFRGAPPYAPAAQLLENLLPIPLQEALRAQLARLLPSLGPVRMSIEEPEARLRLFDAAARVLVEAAADAPLLLLVDDVHWIDIATLELLTFAVRRLNSVDASWVLVATSRSEELAANEEVSKRLRVLFNQGDESEIRLGPLRPYEVRGLLNAAGARHADRIAADVFRRTGGNPLFVLQAAAHLGEGGDLADVPAIRDAVEARLDYLDAATRRVAEAAAVVATPATVDELAAVARLPAAKAGSEIDRLLRAGLLSSAAAGSFGWAHEILREVAYARTNPAQRSVLHARALGLDRSPAELFRHAVASGRRRQAEELAHRAADAAFALGAYDEAAEFYAEAPEQREVFERWGRCLELVGRYPAAITVYERMLRAGERRGSPALTCSALSRMANASLYIGDLDRTGECLASAQRLLPLAGDDLVAEVEMQLGNLCLYRLELAEALKHLDQAVAGARRARQPHLLARALNTLSYPLLQEGKWDRVIAQSEEAAQIFAALGDRSLSADAEAQVATALIGAGEVGEAERRARHALELAEQIDNDWGRANAGKELALALLRSGRVAEAAEVAQAALLAARRADWAPLVIFNLCRLGAVRLAQGDASGAVEAHGTAAQMAAALPMPLLNAMMGELAFGHLCESLLAAGRADEAADAARDAKRRLRPGHVQFADLRPALERALSGSGQ